jgi:hypothetical protein
LQIGGQQHGRAVGERSAGDNPHVVVSHLASPASSLYLQHRFSHDIHTVEISLSEQATIYIEKQSSVDSRRSGVVNRAGFPSLA